MCRFIASPVARHTCTPGLRVQWEGELEWREESKCERSRGGCWEGKYWNGMKQAGPFAFLQLRLNYPNDKYLKDYCARAYYILTLLLDGYGFTDDTWTNIAFRMTVRAKFMRVRG